MIDRRHFNRMALFAAWGLGLANQRGHAATASGLQVYSNLADRLEHRLLRQPDALPAIAGQTSLPSALQYGWTTRDGRFFHIITSDAPGGSVGAGSIHRLVVLRRDHGGTLHPHGAPVSLPRRPIHNTIDTSGRFALIAYNAPAGLEVFRIRADNSLGDRIEQDPTLDFGIFPHQIRCLPSGRAVVLVTRGNNAHQGHPEEPGALRVFGFAEGHLSTGQIITVGGRNGLGYGPRHLDFHPGGHFAYVAIERQNQLHAHRLNGDAFEPSPIAVLPSTASAPNGPTMAGAIKVHPAGHVVYVANRASATVPGAGDRRVFAGGENSIAVFAIDPATGAPRLIQTIDPRGYYIRDFAIDPGGTVLVAAMLANMWVEHAGEQTFVPAGLSLFHIAADGTLEFVDKLDLPSADQKLMWVNIQGATA